MATLSIDIEAARQIGASLKSAAANGFSEVQSLSARVDPSAVWTGRAAQSYLDAYNQWKKAQADLHQALESMGREVDHIAANFDAINSTTF